jgi:hypothetical protein
VAATDRDGKYFVRRAPWRWHDGSTVDILDGDGKVARTLDGWQTLVFHEADGSKTVAEFISWLKEKPEYDEAGNPVDPTQSATRALAALSDDLKIIELVDAPTQLLEYEYPANGQDAPEA